MASGNKHHPAPSIAVQVMHDKNASVAHVHADSAEYSLTGSGASKRERGDVHDEAIAELLATSRALTDLARQLQSEAARRIAASSKAQEEARELLARKREAAGRPVKRRTKEEWEAMQRARERPAFIPVTEGPLVSEAWGPGGTNPPEAPILADWRGVPPAPTQIFLSGGRTLVIEEDHVVLYKPGIGIGTLTKHVLTDS